jgi:hypothetical protein
LAPHPLAKSIEDPSEIHFFLAPVSEILFSHFLVHLGGKTLVFGSRWRPVASKIAPKSLNWSQRASKINLLVLAFTVLASPLERSWTLFR